MSSGETYRVHQMANLEELFEFNCELESDFEKTLHFLKVYKLEILKCYSLVASYSSFADPLTCNITLNLEIIL